MVFQEAVMIPVHRKFVLLVALALLVAPAVAAKKKEKNEKIEKKENRPVVEQFTGTLVATVGAKADGPGDPVTISIEEYTSDDVALSLMTTLADGGQMAVRDALKKYRVGKISVGGASYPIGVARQRIVFENRVVLLVTESPLDGFKLNPGLLAQDYPMGIIELTLIPDGTGDGKVVGMAKLAFDRERNMRIGSYGTPSAQLTNVETIRTK
jgi:hypothetical protein